MYGLGTDKKHCALYIRLFNLAIYSGNRPFYELITPDGVIKNTIFLS